MCAATKGGQARVINNQSRPYPRLYGLRWGVGEEGVSRGLVTLCLHFLVLKRDSAVRVNQRESSRDLFSG